MKLPRDFSFVFFGLTAFDALPQRDRWLAAEIARRGFRVVYIEPMPSAAYSIRKYLRRSFDSVSNDIVGGHIPVPPGLEILRPPHIPTFFTSSLTPSLDKRIFRRWFSKALRGFPWKKSAAFISYPYWWSGFVDRSSAPARVLLYDRCDSLAVPSRSMSVRRRLEACDRELLGAADIVTFSAENLRPPAGAMPRTIPLISLPNALSREFLNDCTTRRRTQRNEPTIGMCGAFNTKWVDGQLVCETVERFPSAVFSIVGPVDRGTAQKLRRYPHVRLFGSIPFPQLPSIMSTWDAAMIPFRRNEISDSINPLKMYEYLAAGLPVVATATRELQRYSSHIRLAADAEQFVREIGSALNDRSAARRKSRIQFARRNTWTHRVDTLLHAIESAIPKSPA